MPSEIGESWLDCMLLNFLILTKNVKAESRNRLKFLGMSDTGSAQSGIQMNQNNNK
jgi:hypothetical protein